MKFRLALRVGALLLLWQGVAGAGAGATSQDPSRTPSVGHVVRAEVVLMVTVTGIDRAEGLVRLALFDGAERFTEDPVLAEVLAAEAREVVWRVRVPAGQYAVAAVHDRDANGKLNTNFLGMPTERYGFSNGARGTFGPPSFEDARFAAAEPLVSIGVEVR